ncbi:MAG: hypothetical protein ABIQ95_12105 [Bdellovibrionia bacterium]
MSQNIKFLLMRSGISTNLFTCLLLVLTFEPLCRAELNYQDMKGVHDLINPDYDYLSPIYGFTLLSNKTLENMRFYGNFGPKRAGFGCLEKNLRVNHILAGKNDCPQDATSELIQRLFPSPDGVHFEANELDSDPVSHLKPQTIGRLLERISLLRDSELSDVEKAKQLGNDMKDILSEGLNPLSYFEKMRSRLKKQQRARGRTPEEKRRIETEIAAMKEHLKKYNLHGASARKGSGKEKDFEELSNLLLSALKEASIGSYLYPRNLPEQILLAYFWKKGNGKEDFVRLLSGMPRVLRDGSFFKETERKTNFLRQKYSGADYDLSSVTGESKNIAKNLLEHPERLIFYVQQDRLGLAPLPPFLYFTQAWHSSLGDGPFSNCGETSLRTFFDIAFYNQKDRKFDIQYIQEVDSRLKVARPGFQIHPSLMSFYQKHPYPKRTHDQFVRDEWSDTVALRAPGGTLSSQASVPQCSIKSAGGGIDNMMEALNRLLFNNEQGPEKEESPMRKAEDRSKKLDSLCKALSRDGFQLSWNLKDLNIEKINTMKFGDIQFKINGKPSFVWKFKEGHFSIQEIPADKTSWKDEIAQDLFRELFQRGRRSSPVLLHWFVNDKNLETLATELPKKEPEEKANSRTIQTNLIYSLPLSSKEGKLVAFQKILQFGLESLYPLAKRLQSELPVNDRDAQKMISSVLADYDYPWGEPVQTISGAVYQRVVGRPDLAALGRAWQNPKDPKKLIWGDIAKLEDGSDNNMDHLSAETYCKSLKARLPTKEEFETLAKDLGNRPSHYYHPVFLPNLLNRWFWSSTVLPDAPQFAATFNGSAGIVNSDNRDSLKGAVRCVAN